MSLRQEVAESQNPVRDAPQRSFGTKFCCRCQQDKPTKGSKQPRNGLFTCADCAERKRPMLNGGQGLQVRGA